MGSSAIQSHAGMATFMPAAVNNTFDNFSRDVGDYAASKMSSSTLPAQDSNALHLDNQDGNNDLTFTAGAMAGLQDAIALPSALQAPPLIPLNTDLHIFNDNAQPEHEQRLNDPQDTSFTDTNPISAMSAVSEMSLNPEQMKGYAQLVFPDGEYLVTSTEIMLGRDERAQQILKEQEKRIRKEQRELAFRQAQMRAAEHGTRVEDRYQDPSEQGDDQSEVLEGRPAPGLPSTFSETGGIVNYEGSVDGMRRKRNKRRSMLLSRSSSNNSVTPASLHVYDAAASPWHSNEDSKCIFLPIHPFQAEDIRKISKEHLRIFYDSLDKHWKMEIKGNGAFVLNELYQERAVDPETGIEEATPRHFKRGDTVILTHNTEILVTSLTFAFKLPYRRGMSTFDSEDEQDSDALQVDADDESSGDDSDNDVKQKAEQLKRPKILLKATKPAVIEEHADVKAGIGSKGGKTKPKEPGTTTEQVATPDQSTAPPVFDANSTLQHVPVNELPEKRKGPGRPPKNGLVSKRDEGIIRRKMKEYEKRGERPPPYKDILAVVRAENRAKELAAKAAARGEPMPSGMEHIEALPPTIDVERATEPAQTPVSAPIDPVQSIEPNDNPIFAGDNSEAKMQAPQRTYRSPSPMKPKEEYTEEQLKRPTQTYYYILDEILSEDPEEAMELQQIYDKICKKYPFYRYVVESNGWQSSVRHNLKQNERFKPVSKQGKGWLWAIDPTIALDKEKKKKPTPPPMPRPMYDQNGVAQPGMAYGNYMQYGQQGYHNPGQQINGHQAYRSPYTQGAPQNAAPQAVVNGQVHAHPNNPQQQVIQSNGLPRTSQPPSRPASNTPQPAAAAGGALPPAFQDLVEEIMRFRVEYLSPFQSDQAAYTHHERIFKRCVEWISQLHMRQNPEVKFENEEERRVFQILEQMRFKFEQGSAPVAPAVPAASAQESEQQPSDEIVQVDAQGLPIASSAVVPDGSVAAVAQQSTSDAPIKSEESVSAQPLAQPLPVTQISSVADAAEPPSAADDQPTFQAIETEAGPIHRQDLANSSSDTTAGVKRQAEDDTEVLQGEEKRARLDAA